MAISRFAASRVTQGLPKYQSAWDQDNVQQGAMVPIATVVGTGAAATALTFSSIPQIYQDLRLVVSGGLASADGLILVTFNNNFTTDLSGTRMNSNGSVTASTRSSGGSTIELGVAGTFATGGFMCTVDISNYTSTTAFKSMIVKMSSDLNGSGNVSLTAGVHRSTAALTSFNFNSASAIAFQPGTTATLYGIKAGA
jgi:hypothetical protein